jgi:hypothetical protein
MPQVVPQGIPHNLFHYLVPVSTCISSDSALCEQTNHPTPLDASFSSELNFPPIASWTLSIQLTSSPHYGLYNGPVFEASKLCFLAPECAKLIVQRRKNKGWVSKQDEDRRGGLTKRNDEE